MQTRNQTFLIDGTALEQQDTVQIFAIAAFEILLAGQQTCFSIGQLIDALQHQITPNNFHVQQRIIVDLFQHAGSTGSVFAVGLQKQNQRFIVPQSFESRAAFFMQCQRQHERLFLLWRQMNCVAILILHLSRRKIDKWMINDIIGSHWNTESALIEHTFIAPSDFTSSDASSLAFCTLSYNALSEFFSLAVDGSTTAKTCWLWLIPCTLINISRWMILAAPIIFNLIMNRNFS